MIPCVGSFLLVSFQYFALKTAKVVLISDVLRSDVGLLNKKKGPGT